MDEGQGCASGLIASIKAALPNPRKQKDAWISAGCEAALILVVSVAGWLSRAPLIFASLGPTAFSLVATPRRRSAHAYNILAGHATGVAAGFAALYVTHAFDAPRISSLHVPLVRVWAVTLAVTFTTVGMLLLRARQPAALSTTMLISIGLMQTWKDALIILCSVLLMTAIGEPLRHWREEEKSREQPGPDPSV